MEFVHVFKSTKSDYRVYKTKKSDYRVVKISLTTGLGSYPVSSRILGMWTQTVIVR